VHGIGVEADRAGEIAGAFQHEVNRYIRAVRLGHEDRVHQRVREDFGVGFLADGSQQFLAVRGCRPRSQYEGSHMCPGESSRASRAAAIVHEQRHVALFPADLVHDRNRATCRDLNGRI